MEICQHNIHHDLGVSESESRLRLTINDIFKLWQRQLRPVTIVCSFVKSQELRGREHFSETSDTRLDSGDQGLSGVKSKEKEGG